MRIGELAVGGAAFRVSLAAARLVTGRVVVYGVAGGEATIATGNRTPPTRST
ncbi:hypothetical protein [Micromonospora sp. NPDC000018]|uniref:hypothetical protein n=1 Tax=Micromonospora sp. NPDC000018 TaxID=3154239 RepID=UPI003322D824